MTNETFEHLHNYVNDLEDVFADYRRAAPLAQLNVMTTFSICDSKFLNSWGEIAQASRENLGKAAEPCVNAMFAQGFGEDIGEDATKMICERTFFTRAGSMYIREQVEKAVLHWKGTSGHRLLIVDMFQLTDGNCDKTSDGRHYDVMVLQQLDKLFTVNGW